MDTDAHLLRQFAAHGDNCAFAEVVRRHADLVYSVALRVTANSALAQDVTQTVFTLLARRATALSHYDTLVGWLHTTTRNTAINAVRGEERRRAREHEAATMQDISTTPEANWAEIGPLLDEAVGTLREDDRKAVLLRFFKNLSHQEVGAALGLSEDSARKRVERALEKLRAYFTSRGVTTSSAILAAAISKNSVQAAPVGLAERITPASLAAVGAAGFGGAVFLTLMSTKTKVIFASAVVLAIAVTVATRLQKTKENAPASSGQVLASQPPKAPDAAKNPSQVAAPVIPPAPRGGVVAAAAVDTTPQTATASAPAATNDPQADLSTAIPHLIELIQSEQLLAAFKQYMPPGYFDGMPAEARGQLKQQEINLLADPNTAQRRERVVQALQSILVQKPAMNAAGDRATYQVDAAFKDVFGAQELSFVKSEGLWFFAPGTEPGFF